MFSSMDVPIRIPESKQHMVLPEIEEEAEDLNQRHSKLSLTSLLLGKVYTIAKDKFQKIISSLGPSGLLDNFSKIAL